MRRIFSILNARAYVEGHIDMPDEDEYPESAANWRYNNTFLVMLINNHLAESELIHTNDCETAHGTWESLRKYHHLSTYQVWIDKSRILEVTKAKESDNIPDFLIKVKKQFETVRLYKTDKYHKMFNDIMLKKAIVTALPRSWDTFAANYVKNFLDKEDGDVDAKKRVDSQELLGIISQEYSRRCDEDRRPSKGDRARSSNNEHSSGNNNNNQSSGQRSQRKKHCNQCDRDGHYTSQCHFLGQNKCSKCGRFGHESNNCYQNNTSGQPSDAKRKASPNNNQNGAKRQRNEAHNADADETAQSANIAIRDENVAYHVAEDGLIDVISENENMSSPSENNKVIHELYDWLADTGTTSHITHRRDAFATYQLVPKIPVSLAGKNVSYAIGKGTIFLQSECNGVIHTLQLNDVLHIPNTDHSLLSLGRWEQETG